MKLDARLERAKRNEPLARHTTFRIGGPADFFLEARTSDELVEWVKTGRELNLPVLVLGNGSNVLVRDGGFHGLVIKNQCDHYQLNIKNPEQAVLWVESGAALPGLANRLARQGWAGLEWAIGVPGSVGGAVVGNAGAHGSCIADTLLGITAIDEKGQRRELPKRDLRFAYRRSRIKGSPGIVVLSAEFEMTKADPAALVARMAEYTEHRRRTQPADPSIGSMFKNPAGDYAGRLIEQAGLKGRKVGGVEISTVHANFFVNRGGATAAQVLELVSIVREGVRVRFGVELELEIELVGDD